MLGSVRWRQPWTDACIWSPRAPRLLAAPAGWPSGGTEEAGTRTEPADGCCTDCWSHTKVKLHELPPVLVFSCTAASSGPLSKSWRKCWKTESPRTKRFLRFKCQWGWADPLCCSWLEKRLLPADGTLLCQCTCNAAEAVSLLSSSASRWKSSN